MKTQFRTGRSFRVLLPLIMTCVQLGLLAASVIVDREPWVRPYPPESNAQRQSQCSGDNCVSFSPGPHDRGSGRLVNAAMFLNLPAVILGAFLDIGVGLLHVHTNESWLLGFSAVFVPLIWYRVGKWLDDQSTFQSLNQSARRGAKSAWTIVVRVIVWSLFCLLLIAFLVEHQRESEATKFMSAVLFLWMGAYLAGGLLGDWRRRAARRREAVA